MESKRMYKVQELDIITILPQAIVETILCLLPIEEAVKTSILSREWRYKWTTIPKLVFSQFSTIKLPAEEKPMTLFDKIAWSNKETRCALFSAIHQVLLQHKGPIHEFNLQMSILQNSFEIDQIIRHLSRNHAVNKLTLDFYSSSGYGLPLTVLPWPHLTYLYIQSCSVYNKPIFNGSGSLTSLYLREVMISKDTLLHILSNCPSLKSVWLVINVYHHPGDENLSIMELFKYLPMVEHLTTWGCFVAAIVQASVPKDLPSSLIHLKYCTIEDMSFVDGYGLPFLLVLIKCSPNLEKIRLELKIFNRIKTANLEMLEKFSIMFKEYSYVRLEHLNELEIQDFNNSKPELEFVKFILVRAPNLKKVVLLTDSIDKNEESELLKNLSHDPRASPVEIIVENR